MPLKARQFIRKMRGGAQSHLLEAEDGHCYVVKFVNNPQQRRILVNELVSGVLLRHLRIQTPETAIVELTPEFLREHPEVSIDHGPHKAAVAPGWHFGSRYPGHPDRTAIYDFIPDALLEKVENLGDFAGVLAFDKWVANADGRQAVFVRAGVRQFAAGASAPAIRTGFIALMIDHGYAFNGPHWDYPESPVQGLYARRRVYAGVRSAADFQPWMDQIVNFPEAVVDQAFRQVPPEWINGEEDAFEALLERLLVRRRRLPDLVADCRLARASPFPNWP